MSFENFDNKIKEVFDQGSHAYDESSWQKMKILLDKHMPLKKDNRRRIIIFLFMFLLLGGGTTLILLNKSNPENEVKTKLPGTVAVSVQGKEESQHLNKNSGEQVAVVPEINKKNKLTDSPEKSPILKKKIIFSDNNISDKTNSTNSKTTIVFRKETDKSLELNKQKSTDTGIEPASDDHIFNSQNLVDSKKEIIESGKENSETELTDEIISTEKEYIPAEVKKITTKKKQPFLKNILFKLSAGTDISSVGNQTGRVKIIPGIGLGYKISERFSVHTGYSIGKKIYTTAPGDYNPPANFWAYYPNLKHIDADCKVIEIPINLDYRFAISKNHNWFISAGASSFIMKKEEYNYYYKPANSQQYIYYKRSYENKNIHYFSILNLSGGYSVKINQALTLQAEPYMKVALKGVGYGNVKLNSFGMMFSATIQPFQLKK
jgi:hypothetical protein